MFDADVSLIEANKKESKKTYKGFRGMGSLLGFVNGYCLYSDFRNDINILFRTFIKSMPFYVRQ